MEIELTFKQQIELASKKESTLFKRIVGTIAHPWRDNEELLFNVGLGLSQLGYAPEQLDETFEAICRQTNLSFTNSPQWKKHFVKGFWSDEWWSLAKRS